MLEPLAQAWLEARVVLRESEALVRTPLKDLLGGLDPKRFWQAHRAIVVNVAAIAAAGQTISLMMSTISSP